MDENRLRRIKKSVLELEQNLSEIGRVREWSEWMGYADPKLFSEDFLRHHDIRPHKMMDFIRIKSIVAFLRKNEKISNHKIARAHSLPNEKSLNNYINYHFDFSPKAIKNMADKDLKELMKKQERKIQK